MATWFRLDANYADHPKVIGLSDAAFRAHVTLMGYACKHDTGGHIPAKVAAMVHPRVRRSLVDAGLMEPAGNGYALHDWDAYQSPNGNGHDRTNAARQRRWRERQRAEGEA